ncbi:MAG: hypothetical protein Q4A70_02205 [Candidatus Saccharibacteria bacterium]|nr:hypothetical protein [Candidatus Saccharibacteria bacterium]
MENKEHVGGNKFVVVLEQFLDIEGQPRLYRIRALKDIPAVNVKAGDFGGWVENGDNLSQEDTCWIKDCAMVYGGARVIGSALVSGYAKVRGDSLIKDSAEISGFAVVEQTIVADESKIAGQAVVETSSLKDTAKVEMYARVNASNLAGKAFVFGKSHVQDSTLHDCQILDDSDVRHSIIGAECYISNSTVSNSTLREGVAALNGSTVMASELVGTIMVVDNSKIIGSSITGNRLWIGSNAYIQDNGYVIVKASDDFPCFMLYRANDEIMGTVNNSLVGVPKNLAVCLARETGKKLRTMKKLVKLLCKLI